MTKEEALKLALEAMESDLATYHIPPTSKMLEAITAIKEALANVATEDTSQERVDEIQKQRHEQEPVGYVIVKDHGKVNILDFDFDLDVAEQLSEGKYPAYTTPPKRTWVGLTDEERKNIMIECESTGDWAWELKAAQAIEAKLKQKNGYAEEKNA